MVSAREALAGGTAIDLLLSDVVLPGGVGGPEFASELRQRYPSIQVLFMSGYPAEARTGNSLIPSDAKLLEKPFRRRQLAEALSAALRR